MVNIKKSESQNEIIQHEQGVLLVNAGAGSGKTAVILERSSELRKKGVSFEQMLFLTYSKRAVQELHERFLGSFPSESPHIHTFHSFAYKFLGAELKERFTLFKPNDCYYLLEQIIAELGVKDVNGWECYRLITQMHHNLHTLSEMEIDEPLRNVLQTYQERMSNNNAFDFDGMVTKTIELLENNPLLLEKHQYEYITVDEFQDTNYAQLHLLKLLTKKHGNLLVLGDDFQTIFSFSGSKIDNILRFEEHFNESKTVCLEENFRSTKNILHASNTLIQNNQNQRKKKVFTSNAQGDEVLIGELHTPKDEVNFIATSILSKIEAGAPLHEIAILVRRKSQMWQIENAMKAHQIPYNLIGKKSVYQEKEIRLLISYLQMIVSPDNLGAFAQTIKYPKRGIHDKTIGKIFDETRNSSLLNILKNPKDIKSVSGKGKESLVQYVNLLNKYKKKSKTTPPSKLVMELVSELELTKEAKRMKLRERDMIENTEKFIELLSHIEEKNKGISLEEMVSLLLEKNEDDELALLKEGGKVKIMTMHGSKGAEFDHVFIQGLNEHIMPNTAQNDCNLEEERRVLYVAMTRARKTLTITYSKFKWENYFGKFEMTPLTPSCFLKEITSNS